MKDSQYTLVVEAILEKDGKFLVIERPQGVHASGLLAFPGGKVELRDGQNAQNILIEAAKREVKEEVGIDIVDPLTFVTSASFPDEINGSMVVDCLFHTCLEQTDPTVFPSKREVPAFHWLSLEEIEAHPLCPPWVRRYLECL